MPFYGILWYLASNSTFIPNGNYEQAQALQWMFFEQFSHEPNIATSRYWVSILKAEDEYKEQLKVKMKLGYAALDVMEEHLKNNSFFVANQYSIADIGLYAYTHVAEEGNFDIRGNYQSMIDYFYHVKGLLFKWLNRRSQKHSYNWAGFKALLRDFPLIKPHICHGF